MTDNPPLSTHANKIENRTKLKIKMVLSRTFDSRNKVLGRTESKINKNKNGENVPQLEITKVVLVHGNIVKIDYQQDSRVLYLFVSNKYYGQLVISPKKFIFLKTFNSEFSYIEEWLTDQNSKLLEIDTKHYISYQLRCKIWKWHAIQFNLKSDIWKILFVFAFCEKYEQKRQ